jgi:aryl-alcohol dehydrogenase-like predicted oxidoreductase
VVRRAPAPGERLTARPKTLAIAETEVPRIGLGTNRLTNTPEHVEFVRAAVATGVGMIDSAHLYSGGDSEEAIGAALAPPPPGCLVATKGGYNGARPEVLRAEIEQSLRRLRTDAIRLYYLHRVDPEVPLERSLAVIAEYRERGAIAHVGISAVGVEEIERAREVVAIAAVQNHYSLTERGSEDVVDHCAAEGIPFVPYFPLRRSRSRALDRIAERRGASPAQIALAWLLHRSPTMLPIPGTLSLAHLRENLAALEIELSDDELDELA